MVTLLGESLLSGYGADTRNEIFNLSICRRNALLTSHSGIRCDYSQLLAIDPYSTSRREEAVGQTSSSGAMHAMQSNHHHGVGACHPIQQGHRHQLP